MKTAFMHPFLNQNQGYYVFIHEDNSPTEVPADFSGTGSGDGLEWDEEVGENNIPEREDDAWSSLYRWYAQMLEQTEGILENSEASLKATIDNFAKKQRDAAHYAAEQGHVGVLRLLLQTNAKVDACDTEGLTPLHLAVKYGKIAAVQVLLEGAADPNRFTLNPEQTTALHLAAVVGELNIIELLISAGALLEIRDGAERTPLQIAVQEGQLSATIRLLQAGSNVNVEDVHGNTPLCEAVFQNAIRIVETLLLSGARIQPHHCLLHYAVLHQQLEMVQLLLQNGSNVNLRDSDGDTPLLLASRSGQVDMVRLLLNNGATADYPNSLTGSTALHEAVSCSKDFLTFQEIFFCLQSYHVNINTICFSGGDTPLFRAILLERDEIAKLLIKHGADVNLCSLQHCVIDNLSLALARRSLSVARLLVLAGAKPPKDWERLPRPLTHLSRLVLRSRLPPNSLFQSIQTLPLPVLLKDFLMFKNED